MYALWNLATLVGALGAGVIDPRSLGLDAAVGAAFLGLLVPQVRDRLGVRVAVLGAALPRWPCRSPARRPRAGRRLRGGPRRPSPRRPRVIWTVVLAGSAVCFLLKLSGWLVPARALADERVRRLAALLPVGLLAGLVVVQVLGSGRSLVLDARAAGLAAGAVALLLRAPFLVVVVVAAATAAVLRALAG